MGSKTLSFRKSFRTPSALSALLNKMPELDVNELGLGEEDIISPVSNSTCSPSSPYVRCCEKPLRGISCGHIFRKSKATREHAPNVPGNEEDPKVHVKIARSVSFHRLPKSQPSGVDGFKRAGNRSQMTKTRTVLRSESRKELQKLGSPRDNGPQDNISQTIFLDGRISNEEEHDHEGEATQRQRKIVRFTEEPEIIPRSANSFYHESSEEHGSGPSLVTMNIFRKWKR